MEPGIAVTWPRINWWLPAILSTTAGAVDVIGFLVFGGLFTAHITGNLPRNPKNSGRSGEEPG
jgi:hypothetical protein